MQYRQRRSLRLPGYDYSQSGFYYLTIGTYRMLPTLAVISKCGIRLTSLGEIVERCWNAIPTHFAGVQLDALVIMPNHVHGIIELTANYPKRPSLRTIVAAFKGACTREHGQQYNHAGSIWQRNYYERIIRNEKELLKFRRYIATNPLQWQLDRFHPGWRF